MRVAVAIELTDEERVTYDYLLQRERAENCILAGLPRVQLPGGANCTTCRGHEKVAWERQCEFLHGADKQKVESCRRAGVCLSCRHIAGCKVCKEVEFEHGEPKFPRVVVPPHVPIFGPED